MTDEYKPKGVDPDKQWVPKGKRERSILQEHRVFPGLGMSVTPASGALPVASLKGDAQDRTDLYDPMAFIGEAKTTGRQSFAISIPLILKLCNEAKEAGFKSPMFVLTFEAIPSPYPKDWVVIPYKKFQEMKTALQSKE